MEQLVFNQKDDDFSFTEETRNSGKVDMKALDRIVNVHELAFYLNISARAVQYHVDRGIFSREKRGEYRLIPCLHSYLDYLKKELYGFAGFYSNAQQQKMRHQKKEIKELKEGDDNAR